MKDILLHHLTELKKIDNQRKAWLLLSALVIVAVSFIIFNASRLEEFRILWVVGSLGIVLAVVWWFWTMRIVNKVISHRTEEINILIELNNNVKGIKEDILKSYTKDVD
jgi:hypothetical protein